MSFDAVLQLAGFLAAAGAVYGGIRSDLRQMHQRQERLERSIEKAHERIDVCGVCSGRRHGD